MTRVLDPFDVRILLYRCRYARLPPEITIDYREATGRLYAIPLNTQYVRFECMILLPDTKLKQGSVKGCRNMKRIV